MCFIFFLSCLTFSLTQDEVIKQMVSPVKYCYCMTPFFGCRHRRSCLTVDASHRSSSCSSSSRFLLFPCRCLPVVWVLRFVALFHTENAVDLLQRSGDSQRTTCMFVCVCVSGGICSFDGRCLHASLNCCPCCCCMSGCPDSGSSLFLLLSRDSLISEAGIAVVVGRHRHASTHREDVDDRGSRQRTPRLLPRDPPLSQVSQVIAFPADRIRF